MNKSTLTDFRAMSATVVAFALASLSLGIMTPRARALGVLTVTSSSDSGPGSLRDAVASANSGDTILFNLALPVTISLSGGEIPITKTIAIDGPGAAALKISGNSSSRIFNIAATGNLTISDLDIADGAVSSASPFGDITNTGGGIYNAGTLSATNCLFISNQASLYGGAVENLGSAAFTGCHFAANSAGGIGGAISNEVLGTMSIANCDLTGNSAKAAGAISNVGRLSINNTTFHGNSSVADAGAILNGGAPNMSVTNSTFSANIAGTCNCGIGNGGAIDSRGQASFSNCTFNANSAGAAGGAIRNKHFGIGGINPTSGLLTLINCTLSGNSAPTGGGVFGTGGANAGTLNLHNTIIAHSTGGDCVNLGVTGTNNHNLIQDGSCSPFLSGDPMLGPLFPNGGPTDTMALLAGSPAIDAGDDSVLGPPLSLTTDQRGPGFPRKSGLHVDIGAFEFQQFDTCLKDNTSGNLLQWNSATGQYQFTRCLDGFTLTGTGVVGLVNGIRMLTDSRPDRKLSAGFNTAQLTGSATIYLQVAQGVWQTFRINDTNPSVVCKC